MPTTSRLSEPEAVFPKGVSQPATRALNGAGYARFEQLAGLSQSKLLELHGLGPKALRVIQQALIDAGLEEMKP